MTFTLKIDIPTIVSERDAVRFQKSVLQLYPHVCINKDHASHIRIRFWQLRVNQGFMRIQISHVVTNSDSGDLSPKVACKIVLSGLWDKLEASLSRFRSIPCKCAVLGHRAIFTTCDVFRGKLGESCGIVHKIVCRMSLRNHIFTNRFSEWILEVSSRF